MHLIIDLLQPALPWLTDISPADVASAAVLIWASLKSRGATSDSHAPHQKP